MQKNAIAFTEVPEKLSSLGKQRKRWARGMVEAFKKVKTVTSKKMNFKYKFLMCLNLFFPFIDLALLIFVPLGLILLAFGNQLLISWISLLVILMGMLLCLVIEIKRRNMLREVECKLNRRSALAFIFYVPKFPKENLKKILTLKKVYDSIRMYQATSENNIYFIYELVKKR